MLDSNDENRDQDDKTSCDLTPDDQRHQTNEAIIWWWPYKEMKKSPDDKYNVTYFCFYYKNEQFIDEMIWAVKKSY